jgi:hypothetical protein
VPATFHVQDRVIREVTGGDGFALAFDGVHQFGGHDDGVLDQFLGVFGTHLIDVAGDGRFETGNDFFLQNPASFGGHDDFLWVEGYETKHPRHLKNAGDRTGTESLSKVHNTKGGGGCRKGRGGQPNHLASKKNIT